MLQRNYISNLKTKKKLCTNKFLPHWVKTMHHSFQGETITEGSKIDAATSKSSLQQLFNEHLRKFFFLCCFNIYLSSRLVMEFHVHPSLLPNCHVNYQMTYAKFNLKIQYPPSYKREISNYQRVIIDQIRKAIEQFSWDRSFKYLDHNEIVFLFNRTIKNTLSRYIPHEIIICNDQDPPWMKDIVKELINEKNDAFQSYFIIIKIPCYSIKLKIFKMNRSL